MFVGYDRLEIDLAHSYLLDFVPSFGSVIFHLVIFYSFRSYYSSLSSPPSDLNRDLYLHCTVWFFLISTYQKRYFFPVQMKQTD